MMSALFVFMLTYRKHLVYTDIKEVRVTWNKTNKLYLVDKICKEIDNNVYKVTTLCEFRIFQ